jgi:GTPase
MPSIDDLIKKLPADTQDMVRFLWDAMPISERISVQSLLNTIPSNSNLVHLLLRLSTAQIKMAFGSKNRVAIIGPANVGKSTLFNQFTQNKVDHAEVGPLPGTTRINHQADAGLFNIIDTPGADAVGEVGEKERSEALSAASEADFLIAMFDAIQGIKQTELDLYKHLLTLNKPYIIVLNKIDLVKRHQKDVLRQAAINLSVDPEQIIPLVAKDGSNLNQILIAIAMTEPGIVAALGQALPEYRWQLAWRAIVSASTASAVIALTPLPVIDFIPLVITQSAMVLSIARIYNYEITPARAKELVITFGLGFIGRSLFVELSKLGGVPGWMLSTAIATSMTVTMGFAASVWFNRGEKLSGKAMDKLVRQVTGILMESLRGLGNRAPKGSTFQQRITQALEKISYDELELDSDNSKKSDEEVK